MLVKKSIHINKLKLLFIIFFSFKISSLSYISSVGNTLFLLAQLIIGISLLFSFTIQKKINKLDCCFFIFYLILAIATVINRIDIANYIKDLISSMLLYLSIKYGMEKDPKSYFKYSSRILLLYTLFNTISAVYLYPNSMFRDNNNPIFFLGGDNTSIRIYLYSIGMYFANKHFNGRKISFPVLPVLNLLIFSFLRDIGSGKVCLFVIIIGLVFLKVKQKMPKDILLKIALVHIIIFTLLLSLAKIDIARSIVVNILHRDMTLTGRTIIWDITVNKIIEKPVLGYGMIDGMDFQAMLGGITGVNAHNTYLMMLFNGGLILFAIFIIAYFITRKQFSITKVSNWFYVFPLLLFTIMVRSQVEGWDVPWLFPLMVIIFYAKAVMMQEEKVNINGKGKKYES